MKKITFTLLALTALILNSCSKDDNNTADTSKILGTWYLYAIDNSLVNECEKESYIEFTSNNNSAVDYQTWIDDNGDCVGSYGGYSFSYNNNTLTIYRGQETIEFKNAIQGFFLVLPWADGKYKYKKR